MVNEIDVLKDITVRLDQAGVPYMLTGSLAMNYYAQPRMTRDIDLVIDVQPCGVAALASLLGSDYYYSQEAMESAVRRRSMFNVIHATSVIKVHCVVKKPEEYRQAEFARRQSIAVRDFQVWIASKEDLILSKLWWAKDSHSEMQLRDVRNLLATVCDRDYLEQWTTRLGLGELWKECNS